MGNEHFSFVNWHPILDLSYHMGTNHNFEFSYEYASSNPEIDQLCDVNSATVIQIVAVLIVIVRHHHLLQGQYYNDRVNVNLMFDME